MMTKSNRKNKKSINKKRFIFQQGFTLIELMTVMAIIGILAGSITMSLSAQRKRASASKVLTELSAVMQNIYLCKSDDGSIKNPIPNGDICSLGSNYGQWPDVSDADFHQVQLKNTFSAGDWAYYATASDDSVTICCNAKYGKCNKIDGATCNNTTVLK